MPCLFRGEGCRKIESTPLLGFRTRRNTPADVLRIQEDAGLNGFMFTGGGHGLPLDMFLPIVHYGLIDRLGYLQRIAGIAFHHIR